MRTSRRAFLVIALTMFAVIVESEASEWNRFRGPNGSGVAETGSLPTRFGPTENMIWSTPLPSGHSSPVLTDELIFVTAYEGETLFTLCLMREDGTVVWKRAAPRDRSEPLDKRNNPASPSPVTDGRAVFVFFPDYGLISYDLEANERWRLPLGPFDNIYGMGASPILAGGQVILVCDQSTDSYVIAVGQETGEISWQTPRPEAKSGHSTPVIYEPEPGRPQVLVPGSFLLSAYSPTDGEKLWWVGGLSYEMKSTPVMNEEMIFLNGYGAPFNQPDRIAEVPEFGVVLADRDADRDGRLSRGEMPDSAARMMFTYVDLDGDEFLDEAEWGFYGAARMSKNGMLGVRLGGRGDMTRPNAAWSYHRAVPQLPSPILYEGVLYMINDQGIATSLNPSDGEVIAQARLAGAFGNYYSSPVAGDGKIYMISEGGKVAVLGTGGGLEVLVVNDLEEPCYATPAIDAGRIYLRTTNTLFCFGLSE